MQNKTTKDYIQLHFIVLLLGFTAILGTLISVHSLSTVFFRTAIAAVGIYFVLKFRQVDLKIDRSGAIKLLSTGFLISLHWFLFFFLCQNIQCSPVLGWLFHCYFVDKYY
jgi:drug/metabolite transporter (DMT)-like permease